MPFSYTASPMDYGAVSTILRFDACDTRHCVDVTIENDGDDEPDEMFGITLERIPGLNGRITLDPVDGDITIVDNDIDGMILKHSKTPEFLCILSLFSKEISISCLCISCHLLQSV